MSSESQTFEFAVEARQLLQLMIHSVYSDKDVFLRELVSNASDALDKLRLESVRDSDLRVDSSELGIELIPDAEARTLTVRDNGIGMSRDEVVELIGTIAKSGTADFLRRAREAKDAAGAQDLIGQFGVGFYASFMVADRVTLLTRPAGASQGTRWESAGEGTYSIETVDDAPRGTSVTLHLKPADSEEHLSDYTSEAKLREVVKRHSDFITWPITLPAPPAKTDDTAADGEGDSAGEAAPSRPEPLNSMKALWARPRTEVADEEYHEFYKHISHDWTDPLETIRMQAEGSFEYQALLFLPARAPLDLYMQDSKRGVQLYVKRVFIMDDCEALMPRYLRFVKGVVDAQDLTLNVSRETLQQDRQIHMMRRRLVKKVLSTVRTLRDNHPERYRTFWTEFGQAVKEGLVSDPDNQEAILETASFASTHDADEPTSLRGYLDRMKDGQEHIYYMTGESRSIIENSPHMEAFRARGYEVLVLTDRVDEVWVSSVSGYDGTPFQSITQGDVDLESAADREAGEAEREQLQRDFADLLSWMTTTLDEEVKEVRLSARLTTSPACVVGDTDDLSPALESMYRAMGQPLPRIKRILELNPKHPLVTGLRTAHGERGGDDAALVETAELLHQMALLAEGGELAEPARFIRLVSERLTGTL